MPAPISPITPPIPTADSPICIVDDDPSLGRSLGRLLRCAGFCVNTFEPPHAFIAYAETQTVPLVIVDMMMPEISGLEVVQKLQESGRGTKAIVITGRSDPLLKKAALAAGASAYLAKPVQDDDLLAAIHGAL